MEKSNNMTAQQMAELFSEVFGRIKTEIHKIFVGQDELVDHVLSVLFCGGHVLLEGVPGIGKTLLARTLASALRLDFSRIQFTPDLMPSDITGTMILVEKESGGHELQFQHGPIVANFILADEINRATPKTQSALLEAMQEYQVTVANHTIQLPQPFLVIATQNPVEQEGTYPLPEAQLDRFLVKLLVDYPMESDYHQILQRTTGSSLPEIQSVTNAEEILHFRQIVRQVEASEQVCTYAIRLVRATQPGSETAPEEINQSVALGSSPRGAQALLLMAKVRALLQGRFAISCDDVRAAALPVLRHRLLLNFEGHARHVRPDDLIRKAINTIKELTC